MGDTTCPTGWTRNSTFDNRFIYGSSSVGVTGGASNSHNHGGSFSITSSQTTGAWGAGGDTGTRYNWPTHTHTVPGSIGSTDATPGYLSTIVCNSTLLANISNLIMLSDSSTPGGWTRVTAFDNRFPRGSTTYGSTGGVNSHNHAYSFGTIGVASAYSDDVSEPNPNHFPASSYNHTHTFTVTSNSLVTNLPPYKVLLYVKAPASTPVLTQQLITMATATPPLGWTRYSTLDNVFVHGGSSVNLTSQGASTHSHSVGMTSGAPSGTTNTNYSSMIISKNDHTHTATHNSSSVSNVPPYTTTIYIQRLSSQTTTLIGEEMYNQLPSATNLLAEGVTNPTGIADTTPEFQATFTDPDASDTGVYYQIQVNTNNTFNGTTMWDSTKTAMGPISNGSTTPQISYAGTGLSLNGTTYYWRMKVWDQATGESAWSSTAQFTMNASPNTPSTPYCEGTTNPSGVTDVSPEFSAIHTDPDSDAANYYQIEVNTNNTFTGTVMWDSTKTSISNITSGSRSPDISYAGSSLTFTGVTYYWRIKFWDTNNLESSWSAVQQFTTATASAFSAPINCLIEKSNTNANLNVIWSDTASNEDNYEIQRSVNGGGWSTLSGSLPADTTSYLDSTVSNSNTYQYQIRSIFTGPIYSAWCVTPTLDLRLGNIKFEKIQFH